MGKHPFEGLIFEDAPQPTHDLALGVSEFRGVELSLEKSAGGAGELRDIRAVLLVPILLHELPERMDGRVGDHEHQPRNVAEDKPLLLGEDPPKAGDASTKS